MSETKALIETIIEGIQEKKGKRIIVADLTDINDTICNYFVICQGDSTTQVNALVDSIKEFIIYMGYQKETENKVISNATTEEPEKLNKIVIKDGKVTSIRSYEKGSEEEKKLEEEKNKAEIKKNDNINKLISGHFYKKAFDLASKQAHETIENELIQHCIIEPTFEKGISI